MILAIDPGPEYSAFVNIRSDYFPVQSGKVLNRDLFGCIEYSLQIIDAVVIEKPVCQRHSGSSISETAIQAGMFAGLLVRIDTYLVTRSKVKGLLLGRVSGGKTADSQIISYLHDRFASGVPNKGKGKMSMPGFFFGFHDDIWQAYALGVCFIDMMHSDKKKDIDYLNEGRI
jgi:hypothetical protein